MRAHPEDRFLGEQHEARMGRLNLSRFPGAHQGGLDAAMCARSGLTPDTHQPSKNS